MMHAFDALAPSYDRDFTSFRTARLLRQRIQARLPALFPIGAHVLELGCGTGEDALFLAQHGVNVTATDASEGMIAQTRAKIGDHAGVMLAALDINAPPDHFGDRLFAGVYANFGVLNCAHDLPLLARWLAARLTPNAKAGFCVMSPWCLWETLWQTAHLNIRTAFRRWRGSASFKPHPDVEEIRVFYPTVRQISRAFAPYFRREHVMPIGLFLPPTDVYGALEKRPRLLDRLAALDDRFASSSILANFADHYWIEFIRTTEIPS